MNLCETQTKLPTRRHTFYKLLEGRAKDQGTRRTWSQKKAHISAELTCKDNEKAFSLASTLVDVKSSVSGFFHGMPLKCSGQMFWPSSIDRDQLQPMAGLCQAEWTKADLVLRAVRKFCKAVLAKIVRPIIKATGYVSGRSTTNNQLQKDPDVQKNLLVLWLSC